MTITGGSSLSKEDIERMVKEGEEHAAEDKRRREAAEVRNGAEQLVYNVEKLLADNADKLSDGVKAEIEKDVADVKTALAGSDEDAVKAAYEKLSQSQTKIGDEIYQANQSAGAAGESAGAQPDQGGDEGDDIVDAEVVEDDK